VRKEGSGGVRSRQKGRKSERAFIVHAGKEGGRLILERGGTFSATSLHFHPRGKRSRAQNRTRRGDSLKKMVFAWSEKSNVRKRVKAEGTRKEKKSFKEEVEIGSVR